jgi:hypothetical protein
MCLQAFVWPWHLLNVRKLLFTHTVISPTQGRYLHTGQHKHRINAHTNIHALSGIETHSPRVRASEDCSCLRPRGHCDRPITLLSIKTKSNWSKELRKWTEISSLTTTVWIASNCTVFSDGSRGSRQLEWRKTGCLNWWGNRRRQIEEKVGGRRIAWTFSATLSDICQL